MNATEILAALQADGVRAELVNDKIRLTGPSHAVSRWCAAVSDAKALITDALAHGASEAGMTAADEARVRDWLARIGERHSSIVTEVITRCHYAPDARAYFLARASEED